MIAPSAFPLSSTFRSQPLRSALSTLPQQPSELEALEHLHTVPPADTAAPAAGGSGQVALADPADAAGMAQAAKVLAPAAQPTYLSLALRALGKGSTAVTSGSGTHAAVLQQGPTEALHHPGPGASGPAGASAAGDAPVASIWDSAGAEDEGEDEAFGECLDQVSPL